MQKLKVKNGKLAILFAVILSCNFLSAATVTKSFSYGTSPLSVDNANINTTAVTFTSGVDFLASDLISTVVVSITFTKTDGTCATQLTGGAFHDEIAFRLRGPSNNERLIRNGNSATYSGGVDIGNVTVTFDQTAGSTPSGTPATGTFLPDNGNLNNYAGTSPFGSWRIRASDDTGQDPLCVYSYSITITTTNPLPIELLYFDPWYSQKDNNAKIEWVTASERNNDFFTIEKSLNGENWETVSILDGAGNSSKELFYQITDDMPYFGVSYYRLKQTDFDGSFTYSEVKSINNTNDDLVLVISNGDLNVYGNYNNINLFDMNGRRIQGLIESNGTFVFGNLPFGVYIVKAEKGNAVLTRKVVVR